MSVSLAAVVRYWSAMISRQSLGSVAYVWLPATLINCPCCSSFTANTVVAIAVKYLNAMHEHANWADYMLISDISAICLVLFSDFVLGHYSHCDLSR